MEDFKLLVAGGQDFTQYQLLTDSIQRLLSERPAGQEIVIISGAAAGAEMLAERYAAEYGYEVAEFFPEWEENEAAELSRRSDMAGHADACICFWDGRCPRIKAFIAMVNARSLPIHVINY